MASPFPGMDPYLEGSLWSSFHLQFLVEIKRQMLNAVLPEYYPLIDAYRVVTLDSSLRFEPTPLIAKERATGATPPVYRTLALPHAVGMSFIKVQDLATRKTRAVVHLLDPIIKKRPGRRHYLRWRAKMLNKRFSFIEIDLLRQGRRPPLLDPYPESPYCAMVNDPELRPCCEIWPIHLRQSLPTIRVRVAEDRLVNLDLQDAFTKAYDLGDFARIARYDKKLDLQDERDRDWIDSIVEKHAGHSQQD